MIGEKRSSLEILQEIMQLVRAGHKKTRIMYGANLSYGMLSKYIDFLQERGFIVLDAETGRFVVTDTGNEFIRDLDRVTRHFRTEKDIIVIHA